MNYPNRIAWWSLMSSVCPEHVSHLAPEGLYPGNAMDGFASLPASTIRYFTSKRELIRIKFRLFRRSEVLTLPMSGTGYLI